MTNKDVAIQAYMDWCSKKATEFTIKWMKEHTDEWINYGTLPSPSKEQIDKYLFETSN